MDHHYPATAPVPAANPPSRPRQRPGFSPRFISPPPRPDSALAAARAPPSSFGKHVRPCPPRQTLPSLSPQGNPTSRHTARSLPAHPAHFFFSSHSLRPGQRPRPSSPSSSPGPRCPHPSSPSFSETRPRPCRPGSGNHPAYILVSTGPTLLSSSSSLSPRALGEVQEEVYYAGSDD